MNIQYAVGYVGEKYMRKDLIKTVAVYSITMSTEVKL